ncbi:PepSY domain-containing protein [Streptomyces flavofungini]|uniref:PepSY domain-containing protein n=1 Tax=Streptomyces flavofungini TaxID=68200 RepID=UPI0025AF77FD|nr:PepSY domain-containing protein [Streptomyces flavofungini]WJV46143.1 PepSY domain-containing protein [Streptomyces flavofungini]
MKRNIVIATVVAATLVGGGTAAAFALGGDDESSADKSSVQLKHDDSRVNDDRDDADDAAEDAADDDRDDAREDAREAQGDKAENAAEAKGAKVDAAEAVAAALKAKSGTAVSVDLDDDNGGLVWDVDVLGKDGRTWHSVQVDPGTGKVLGSHVERDDDGDDAAEDARIAAALKGASVTAGEAAKAAADKGKVTSVDVDDDGARLNVWDVETTSADGTEAHWNVDLKTGKVTADRYDD